MGEGGKGQAGRRWPAWEKEGWRKDIHGESLGLREGDINSGTEGRWQGSCGGAWGKQWEPGTAYQDLRIPIKGNKKSLKIFEKGSGPDSEWWELEMGRAGIKLHFLGRSRPVMWEWGGEKELQRCWSGTDHWTEQPTEITKGGERNQTIFLCLQNWED